MNISPVSMVNPKYNAVQTRKQPSFKGFGGISDACRLHFSNEELKVLYKEAKNFADFKFCDAKFVQLSNIDSYILAMKFKGFPLNMHLSSKDTLIRNFKDTDWVDVCLITKDKSTDSSFTLETLTNTYYTVNHFNSNAQKVYDDNLSRLHKDFAKYPALASKSDLKRGIAFAYAYETLSSEQADKEPILKDFDGLVNV